MNLYLRLTLMGPMTPSMQDLGRGDGEEPIGGNISFHGCEP
ncbi:hypothetical protein Goari_002296 [Gossypium aridum]|uniref:Uncharacterized protein n=1 Tax=Gossypium aridum TaxID=34290 RepID=A0A7J8Y7W4_GOSAI|nr:hypothetical protein [Gossypium aridum]